MSKNPTEQQKAGNMEELFTVKVKLNDGQELLFKNVTARLLLSTNVQLDNSKFVRLNLGTEFITGKKRYNVVLPVSNIYKIEYFIQEEQK